MAEKIIAEKHAHVRAAIVSPRRQLRFLYRLNLSQVRNREETIYGNRLELSGELSLRLFKGLSLTVNARYERIRDPLGLSKGELLLEEMLLRQRELATDYNYRFSIGLSDTFGSIYSNVVNPRFGSSRGGFGFW